MTDAKHPQNAPRYYSAEQVAGMLDLPVTSVWKHARELGGIKIGQLWRFPENRLPGQEDHRGS